MVCRALVGRADTLCASIPHDGVAELLVLWTQLQREDDAAKVLSVLGVCPAEEDRATVLMQQWLEFALGRELVDGRDKVVERLDRRVDLSRERELLALGRSAGPGRTFEGTLSLNREGLEEGRGDHGCEGGWTRGQGRV